MNAKKKYLAEAVFCYITCFLRPSYYISLRKGKNQHLLCCKCVCKYHIIGCFMAFERERGENQTKKAKQRFFIYKIVCGCCISVAHHFSKHFYFCLLDFSLSTLGKCNIQKKKEKFKLLFIVLIPSSSGACRVIAACSWICAQQLLLFLETIRRDSGYETCRAGKFSFWTASLYNLLFFFFVLFFHLSRIRVFKISFFGHVYPSGRGCAVDRALLP